MRVPCMQACWDQDPQRRPAAAEVAKKLAIMLKQIRRRRGAEPSAAAAVGTGPISGAATAQAAGRGDAGRGGGDAGRPRDGGGQQPPGMTAAAGTGRPQHPSGDSDDITGGEDVVAGEETGMYADVDVNGVAAADDDDSRHIVADLASVKAAMAAAGPASFTPDGRLMAENAAAAVSAAAVLLATHSIRERDGLDVGTIGSTAQGTAKQQDEGAAAKDTHRHHHQEGLGVAELDAAGAGRRASVSNEALLLTVDTVTTDLEALAKEAGWSGVNVRTAGQVNNLPAAEAAAGSIGAAIISGSVGDDMSMAKEYVC